MIWLIFRLLAAGISSCLYRLGGKAGFNTKYRDIGVSAVIVALMALSGQIKGIPAWFSLIPCFGLMWGALSTYHYFLPKPKDYQWWHYAMHGFFVSLALFPLMFFTGKWGWFIARVLICTIGLGLWSFLIKQISRRFSWKHWDEINEGGRGFILCITVNI
jgi:hypothetical protein